MLGKEKTGTPTRKILTVSSPTVCLGKMLQLNQNYLQDNGPLFVVRQMLSVGIWCFMLCALQCHCCVQMGSQWYCCYPLLEIWRILNVKGGSLNRKSFCGPETGISLKVELCSYMYGRRRGQSGSTLLETYRMKGP